MDEKKVREAIKAMENQIAIIQKIPEYLGLKEKTDKQIEERQTAIEALEKQLPEQPELINNGVSVCEECGAKVFRHYAFCRDCGQKLKWSE